jgi:hypothetical protein
MPATEPVSERSEGRRGAPAPTATPAPPRLRFHLGHHLKLLLVLNIFPLLAGIWMWWNLHTGKATLKEFSQESKTTLVIVLVAGVIFALTAWFVMPLARWLRDYPTWHLRRGPAWAWIIPTCSGWLAWLALSTAGMLACAATLMVAGLGLWHLFKLAA